jgi:hypothetical protein
MAVLKEPIVEFVAVAYPMYELELPTVSGAHS